MTKLKPDLPIGSVISSKTILTVAVLIAILVSGMMVFPVLADAPTSGTVVEGVSVPGAALGDTRAQVEAAFGAPYVCQDSEVGGDLAFCLYRVDGGGAIDVHFQGSDGRYASNSPDDIVYQVGWAHSGWTTTAGVNTALALDDRQAVADAYPDAEVTYDGSGTITDVEDTQLGISVNWSYDSYTRTTNVYMKTYTPPATLAAGSSIHVADIDVTGDKIKGRRPVIVTVSVRGEQGQPVYGATVFGTWTYPWGATQTLKKVTSFTGYAFFSLYDAGTKTWSFTVDDVLLDGHPLDRENSTLNVTFDPKNFK